MQNIHPLFVHFPIALTLTALLFALTAGIIGFGASYGGRMVYDHGIGTAFVTSKTINAKTVNPKNAFAK